MAHWQIILMKRFVMRWSELYIGLLELSETDMKERKDGRWIVRLINCVWKVCSSDGN